MDVPSISGVTGADGSGNHYDGTLSGFTAPFTTAGRIGDALSYPTTGIADLHVPAMPLNTTAGGDTTVAFWYFFHAGAAVDDDVINFPSTPRYDIWITNVNQTYICFNT